MRRLKRVQRVPMNRTKTRTQQACCALASLRERPGPSSLLSTHSRPAERSPVTSSPLVFVNHIHPDSVGAPPTGPQGRSGMEGVSCGKELGFLPGVGFETVQTAVRGQGSLIRTPAPSPSLLPSTFHTPFLSKVPAQAVAPKPSLSRSLLQIRRR